MSVVCIGSKNVLCVGCTKGLKTTPELFCFCIIPCGRDSPRSSGIRAIGRTRLRPHRIVRLSFHPEAEPKWLFGMVRY